MSDNPSDNPYSPDPETETAIGPRKELPECTDEEILDWLEGFGLKDQPKRVIAHILATAKRKGEQRPDLALQLSPWHFQINWSRFSATVEQPLSPGGPYRVLMLG